MFFNVRIINTVNSFPSKCQNSQVFTHSDLKIVFSFAIIGSIAGTTLIFVTSARKYEQWNFVFKCKKVTNFELILEKTPGYYSTGVCFLLCDFEETIYLNIVEIFPSPF